MNDLEIYQKLQDRDQEALIKLVDLYSAPVFKLVTYILKGVPKLSL